MLLLSPWKHSDSQPEGTQAVGTPRFADPPRPKLFNRISLRTRRCFLLFTIVSRPLLGSVGDKVRTWPVAGGGGEHLPPSGSPVSPVQMPGRVHLPLGPWLPPTPAPGPDSLLTGCAPGLASLRPGGECHGLCCPWSLPHQHHLWPGSVACPGMEPAMCRKVPGRSLCPVEQAPPLWPASELQALFSAGPEGTW